ncbi:MAG: hypothetical protein JXB49_17350 [Bacteroidales bacterium]|nr:hypothetical protein [Bacteroidales bacterium]MBN2862188.1 hypothetical protein [Bacteroidales bacterium]
MKITDIVINRINRFRSGYIFTYSDFDIPVDKVEALKKTLSRLVASGKIVRLAKGQFYKPEISEFGVLRPKEYQVVKDLLEEDNKVIGYLTGLSAFNFLGLTTQVSNTIQIGTNIQKKPKKRGKYSIRFILQKNNITKDNIYMLQILDSIRFIKRIPDSDVSESCRLIIDRIGRFYNSELISLVKLATKYNPGTRALAGAIIEQVSYPGMSEVLFNSLNPVSEFIYGISENVLSNKLKWRIS